MKVLIVGLNYEPKPIGIGPYTTGLAEYLAERGHRVEVGALIRSFAGLPGGARKRPEWASPVAGITSRTFPAGRSESSIT